VELEEFPLCKMQLAIGFPRSVMAGGISDHLAGFANVSLFFGLVAAGIFIFPPRDALAAYVFYLAVLSALLVAIAWFKGEPLRWRWGKD
jgi:hypothetical protein